MGRPLNHNTELENISFLLEVQWPHLKRFDQFCYFICAQTSRQVYTEIIVHLHCFRRIKNNHSTCNPSSLWWCTHGSVSFRFGVISVFNVPWLDHWLQSWCAAPRPCTTTCRAVLRARRLGSQDATTATERICPEALGRKLLSEEATTPYYKRHECGDPACLGHCQARRFGSPDSIDSQLFYRSLPSCDSKHVAYLQRWNRNYIAVTIIEMKTR